MKNEKVSNIFKRSTSHISNGMKEILKCAFVVLFQHFYTNTYCCCQRNAENPKSPLRTNNLRVVGSASEGRASLFVFWLQLLHSVYSAPELSFRALYLKYNKVLTYCL